MSDPFLSRLKAAQRDLIEDCGTLRRLEEKFGFSRSVAQRWGDSNHPDLMPLNAVRVLEADCGTPWVTSVMAEVTGRRLTSPEQERAAAACVMQGHADLVREFAELSTKLALAYADGRMTPAEATVADRASAGMEEALRSFRNALAVVKANGGANAGLRLVGDQT
jgi:hypothetical protein